MMYRALALGALAAPLALAAPVDVVKRQDIDPTVLQFALTLEHLENVFYKQALTNFTQGQFAAAGFGPNYYNNLRYISSDEEDHVKFLSTALQAAGQTPTVACSYKFPYTDVASFITLSTVLEGVGTSAYLGAAGLITNKDYLTAAGAILVTEALHTSFQRNAVKAVPMANPYGTPLEPNSVYSLASAFIVSCPPGAATLPFKPYPALTYDGTLAFGEEPNNAATLARRDANWEPYGTSSAAPAYTSTCTKKSHSASTYAASSTVTYAAQSTYAPSSVAPQPTYSHAPSSAQPTYASSSAQPTYAPTPVATAPVAGTAVTFTGASSIPAGSFLTFVSGLTVASVAGTINGAKITAAIPTGIAGQTYVFVTKSAAAGNKLDTASILFGPSILEVKPAPPAIDFSQQK